MTYDLIRDSKVFFCLATENFFKDEKCKWQKEYARSLGEPFRVALKRGVKIPGRFFEGIEDIQFLGWGDRDELEKVTMQLLEDIID